MKKKLKGNISYGGRNVDYDKDLNDDPSNPYLKQLKELPFYMEDIRQVSIDKRFGFFLLFEMILYFFQTSFNVNKQLKIINF